MTYRTSRSGKLWDGTSTSSPPSLPPSLPPSHPDLIVRREILVLSQRRHRLLELLLERRRGRVVGRRPQTPFDPVVGRGQ